MNPLFDIETFKTDKGLYESFYFRGNHQDGSKAFWLKHNLIRFNDSSEIRFDNIFIEYDKLSSSLPKVFQQSKSLTLDEISRFRKTGWNGVHIQFENGFFVQIDQNLLKGTMKDVSWNFELERSQNSYYHFDRPWFYRGFFPKKKILTCDIDLKFSDPARGAFNGMNGHNWGTEHAFTYAYANSNQFRDLNGSPVSAYFDGFSAKIKIGPWTSPFLSSGALHYDDRWYYFNQVASSFKHKVTSMDSRNWSAVFTNQNLKMKLEIFGDSTEANKIPWVELIYDHPSRKLSKVENTKFAKGKISLFDSDKKITELFSDYFELETLSEIKRQ